MKQLVAGALLAATMLFAQQAEAVEFTANEQFRNVVDTIGIHEAGDDTGEGVVYALYEDFDQNGFRDLYYIVTQKNSMSDYYGGDYSAFLYMNDALVFQERYNGPYQGLASANSLAIAYAQDRLYVAKALDYRAWDNQGIVFSSFNGTAFSPSITFEQYQNGEVFNKQNGYYVNGLPQSKVQYEALYEPYARLPWLTIIDGTNGDNLSPVASGPIVRRVLADMEAEETLYLDGRRFRDIPADSEYFEAIEQLVSVGAVAGNRYLYQPSKPVTRGQAAKMLALGLGLMTENAGKMKINFTDVPKKHEYYPYVSRLKELGIMNGYNDTTFGVNEPLKRSHMAKLLVKALRLPQVTTTTHFTDIHHAETRQYVNSLAAYEIVNTAPTTFKPAAAVTRAQMALFLQRAAAVAPY